MAEPIHFSKMHGLSNDFVVMEGITQPLPSFSASRVKALAQRRLGIGFDQLLVLQAARDADSDFYYRIFNADGGEVGQCGNGVRCAHVFLLRRRLTDKKRLVLATITTRLTTQVTAENRVRAIMPPPRLLPPQAAAGYRFEHVEIGNPHYVCLENEIGEDELSRLGSTLNERVEGGINVGFAAFSDAGIRLRVYERGAGLTAACGSGALAAAVVAIRAGKVANPVTVTMPGGVLLCGIDADGHIWLEGEAAHVFDGVIAAEALGALDALDALD